MVARNGWIYTCIGFLLIWGSAAVHAQSINPDRPGIGSDPETVPQFTLEPEVGTDSREIRLGVLKHFELDRDDSSWGAKLGLVDNTKLQLSFKLAYDNSLKTVIEVPANYKFNSWFNLGTDVMWSHSSQVYAGEFNFTPTSRLTITPTVYYDTKARGAIFAAWVLPRHDNVQFDIGYDKSRISVGVSTAFDLAKLLK